MAYRPQHCTLVVQNTDGSGYLRQFETLAEAKVAYASISASGAAVSLYQPATSSLALFENGGDAPEYDNGMTYGTGAVVKLNGRLYRLINFIGAGGYGPISHPSAWEDGRVPATGGPPPISNTNTQVIENGVERIPFNFTPTENATPVRMTKIGCETTQEREADGYITFCAIRPIYRYTLPDGTIIKEEVGEKDSNGCHYPAGFKLNFVSGGEFFREVKILKSLDYSGTVYADAFRVDYYMGSQQNYEVADGYGGKGTQTFVSLQVKEGDSYREHYFQDGDAPYKTTDAGFKTGVWDTVGYPVPNGNYLVTYKVTGDERIHSGHWNVSIVSAGSSPRGKWVFTPEEPDQPPPPPCSVLRRVTNSITGSVESQCDPDVVYPYTVTDNCEPPATVTINGTEIVVGTNIKTGMNNGYGDVVWGACSGMIYKPNGMHIFDDSDYNYYSNGIGGFYSELKNPSQCPSSGSRISREVTSDYTVTIGGSIYTVGYQYEDTIADGNCGSGIEVSSEYSPNGTLIVQYDGNNYFSNGAGNYYSEPIAVIGYEGAEEFLTNEFFSAVYRTRVRPQYEGGSVGEWSQWNYIASGTLFGSSAEYNYYSDGAGSYYTEPKAPSCPSYGTQLSSNGGTYYANVGCGDWNVGDWSSTTYADGSCGTYTSGGANYVGNGTFLGNCNDYNYYSNGSGGYYQGEYTGTPSCPQSGTQISSDSGTYYADVGCGNWSLGDWSSATYADGSCGSYTSGGSNYVGSGTLLGNCNDYNYYSNGSGGYYQGEYTGMPSCDSAGTWISGNSSDITFSSPCGNFTVGQSTYSTYADGMCGTYSESGSNYLSSGTYLGYCGSDNYYSDGAGSAYSYVAAGTATGNSSSGSLEISINENIYNNGYYSSFEYHDGNGGYYTQHINTYNNYGNYITSIISGYNSEMMTDIYTYYYSDGNGGYYTSN